MVTTGQIISVAYDKNTCEVRLPVFETVQDRTQVILSAHIAVQPGICNAYKKGDMVWVTFHLNRPQSPIVFAKIYSSAEEELLNSTGAINCRSLTCADNLTIPEDTLIKCNDGTTKSLSSIIQSLTATYYSQEGLTGKNLATRYKTTFKVNTTEYYLETAEDYTNDQDNFKQNIYLAGFTDNNNILPVYQLGGLSAGIYINNNYQVYLNDSLATLTDLKSTKITQI